ncbi:hypothetical protein [Rhizobium sullae]|uniref:hypothetical protein n=1 Tax=Rhizobium sullae TaxID=50338 RepID=UPI0015C5E578|nr:hypothetical protein [Rhizobium sullae]
MNYQPISLIDGSGEVEEARRLQQRQTINAASVQLGAAVKAASALARWANRRRNQ